MLLTWAPECLRSAGIQVVETSGWTSRSHGAFPDSISGIWHHDASPPGDSPGSLNWMIDNWNNASANFWVNRQGVWYCVGAGVAWHAGSVLSGMPNNYSSFGVETDQTVNEVPSQAMLTATRKGFAALLKRMGRNAQSLHFHKTVASPVGRKQDPWFDNGSNNQGNWQNELNRERNNVQAIMDGGTGGGDWLDMVSKEELITIVNDTVANVLRAPEFRLTDWDQKSKKSFYRVYRHTNTQWDYAAGPGRFKFINSDDDYHFLTSAGWINIGHGQAQQVETNLLEYIRAEASKGAQPGAIDDIQWPAKSL